MVYRQILCLIKGFTSCKEYVMPSANLLISVLVCPQDTTHKPMAKRKDWTGNQKVPENLLLSQPT